MKLSDRAIKASAPGDTLRDTVVRGLQLRVFAERRVFYFYYRPRAGSVAERRPKIGEWPTVSLDTARAIAQEWAGMVARGLDPAAELANKPETPTVADMLRRYLKEHAKKKKSYADDARMVERIIIPDLGDIRVCDLNYDHVAKLHSDLARIPIQANRVLALMSKACNLAELWGLRAQRSNPCRFVARYPEQKRKRYMTADEAPRIAALLAEAEAHNPQAVLFIYMLILTGARPEEIARARPEWIDGAVLRLPDSKVGARPVYLPPAVQALLQKVPANASTLTGIQSPRGLWRIIRVKAGCPDLRLYDLRHTFASAALAAGYSLDQIGTLLGHASPLTTKRYAHLIEGKAIEVVTGTAGYLENMMKKAG